MPFPLLDAYARQRRVIEARENLRQMAIVNWGFNGTKDLDLESRMILEGWQRDAGGGPRLATDAELADMGIRVVRDG